MALLVIMVLMAIELLDSEYARHNHAKTATYLYSPYQALSGIIHNKLLNALYHWLLASVLPTGRHHRLAFWYHA
jgi:hypothetical protein